MFDKGKGLLSIFFQEDSLIFFFFELYDCYSGGECFSELRIAEEFFPQIFKDLICLNEIIFEVMVFLFVFDDILALSLFNKLLDLYRIIYDFLDHFSTELHVVDDLNGLDA